MFEVRQMVEAARKYKRIVQCPSNSRSPNGFQEAVDWAWQGNLGKIRLIYGVRYGFRPSIGKVDGPQPIPSTLDYDMWSGPAPVLPLMRKNLHYDWHWQWPYGGGELANWGPHILDGCRMATKSQSLPRHVITVGGRFGYVDDGQTPNSQLIYYDYEPAPIVFDMRGLPKGKLSPKVMDSYLDQRQNTVIHCEHGYIAHNKAFDKDGKLIQEFKPTTPDLYVNFIEAVRSRKRESLTADILDGHLTVSLIHMANISYRIGETVSSGEVKERIAGKKDLREAFDRFQGHLAANEVDLGKIVAGPLLTIDPATEQFTGELSARANPMRTREYRKPFVVPDKV